MLVHIRFILNLILYIIDRFLEVVGLKKILDRLIHLGYDSDMVDF